MVSACLHHQQGIVAFVPTAQAEAMAATGFALGVTDLGIEGHASQRSADEDRRDDGTPV